MPTFFHSPLRRVVIREAVSPTLVHSGIRLTRLSCVGALHSPLACPIASMKVRDITHSWRRVAHTLQKTIRGESITSLKAQLVCFFSLTWSKLSFTHFTVFTNIWGIHMNPERYADPETFNPERFESHTRPMSESMRNPDPRQRDH